MRDWVGAGLDPALFARVTPREMRVMLDGSLQAHRRAAALAYSHAELIRVAFHAPNRMPAFDQVFPKPGPKKRRSPAEIFAALSAWAAARGGSEVGGSEGGAVAPVETDMEG